MQEVLGSPPKWMVRWGITVIVLVIMMLLVGSYYFKYPDIIDGRVVIFTKNPPATLTAKASGEIDKLFVEDNDVVVVGQPIALIKNPARFQDIHKVKEIADSIEQQIFNGQTVSEKYSIENHLILGSVQTYYTNLLSKWEEYENFIKLNYHQKQIRNIRKQIKDFRLYYDRLKSQRNILVEQLALEKKQLVRNQSLFENNVIPAAEYEKVEKQYLQTKYAFEGARTTLASTKSQITQIEQQLLQLQFQKTEKNNQFLNQLKESHSNLKNQIAIWEESFLIKATQNGHITFTDFWSDNQFVSAGQMVFTIVPNEKQELIGRILFPLSGSGKVELGQKVNIKLDNYPYMEFGMLEGVITNISLVPQNTEMGIFYSGEISLSSGLETNYKKQIKFSQEMQGTAEIITNDKRLIERFIEPIIAALKKHS